MKEKTCFSVNGTYLMLDSFTVLNLIFCRIHYIFMEIRNTWLQTFITNSKKYCEKKLMFASFSFILQLWNEKIWNTFNQKRNFELRTENFELNFFRRPFESSCSWFTFVFNLSGAHGTIVPLWTPPKQPYLMRIWMQMELAKLSPYQKQFSRLYLKTRLTSVAIAWKIFEEAAPAKGTFSRDLRNIGSLRFR